MGIFTRLVILFNYFSLVLFCAIAWEIGLEMAFGPPKHYPKLTETKIEHDRIEKNWKAVQDQASFLNKYFGSTIVVDDVLPDIYLADISDKFEGVFDTQTQTISISDQINPKSLDDTIQHEMLHFYQHRSGYDCPVDELVQQMFKMAKAFDDKPNLQRYFSKKCEIEAHLIGYFDLSDLDPIVSDAEDPKQVLTFIYVDFTAKFWGYPGLVE